jgi:DNA-binding transcriptional LysR family regulator
LHGEVAGEVRLSTVASAAATMVSIAAIGLRSRHPDISLHVRTAEPARSVELLLAGDVDVALIDEYDHQPIALPDYLVVQKLRTEPLVVVAPLGAIGAVVTLADLRERDWVMPPDDAACGIAVRSACRAEGYEPRVRWETDDMLLLTRAVAAGHGVAVLPRLAVDSSVPGVDLHPLTRPELTRRLALVVRSASTRRPVIAAVISALAEAGEA